MERVRAAVRGIPGADALVGGDTAAALDMDAATRHDNLLIIPLVLLVVLIILALVLRALLAPLLLIATVVLSFAAALGVSALAFRYLFDYAGETTDFPLFVFVFLVALGIDYNIFLVTRIRGGRAPGHPSRRRDRARRHRGGHHLRRPRPGGHLRGARHPSRGRLRGDRLHGGLGVLLDTFVVRSILVTSLFLDIGPRVWWPHRPERGTARAR